MTLIMRHTAEDGTVWAVIESGPCSWCHLEARHAHYLDPDSKVGSIVIILPPAVNDHYPSVT